MMIGFVRSMRILQHCLQSQRTRNGGRKAENFGHRKSSWQTLRLPLDTFTVDKKKSDEVSTLQLYDPYYSLAWLSSTAADDITIDVLIEAGSCYVVQVDMELSTMPQCLCSSSWTW